MQIDQSVTVAKAEPSPTNYFLLQFTFLTLLLIALLLGLSANAYAGSQDEEFKVARITSDGKNGRPFSQIRQKVAERPIASVTVRLQKQTGGNDTFVNLRFGSGQTFESGRREALTDTQSKTITWNLDGQTPNGQPLVFNAYNGEVYVHSLSVRYADSTEKEPERGLERDRVFEKQDDRPHRSQRNAVDESESLASCRDNFRRVRPPRIEISELRASGGLFSGKYRLGGVISGQCIEEAGYYEQGRLKEKIEVPLSDRFNRTDFRVQVRSGRGGEIRAFLIDGTDESVFVDDEITKSEQQRPF
jgi:hypothetical protein